MTIERDVAVKILVEITKNKGYNNIVLKRTLDKSTELSKSQKAFVTETVNGTLRNLIYIDYLIDSVSRLETSKMKPFILNNLRAAVYQLFFLSAPDYAVCSEAVELTKENGHEFLAGFVNGILRNLIRGKDSVQLPDRVNSPVDFLSIKYSCPKWMSEYFVAALGLERSEKLLETTLQSANVSIAVNTIKTTKDKLMQLLESDGVSAMAGSLINILAMSSSADMTKLEAYKQGLFHVIDQSSYLAVLALDPKKGSDVLDICAAPGGKSLAIASIMENTGNIEARDIHEHKLELLRMSAKRMGISNITTKEFDATMPDENSIEKFDFVLIDAPCSGLGLIRKKPDIKLTKTKADVLKLAELQRSIMKSAANYVKPGGTLVYCSCTLTAEENEQNANWFSQNFGFDVFDLRDFAGEHGLPEEAVIGGYIRVLPYYINSDGFFISKFIKRLR